MPAGAPKPFAQRVNSRDFPTIFHLCPSAVSTALIRIIPANPRFGERMVFFFVSLPAPAQAT
jgi:hypothetical protein